MNLSSSRARASQRRTMLATGLAVALGLSVSDAGAAPSIADAQARLKALQSGSAHAMPDIPAFPTGNVRVVENCADDGSPGSLRAVINSAENGDTIDLTARTDCVGSKITLTDGEIPISANVTILGPGQDRLTIDGGGLSRIFAPKYAATISDVTIANGFSAEGNGGCIYAVGDSSLTLVRSSVTACKAGDGSNTYARGGAVYAGGTLQMVSSTVSQSEAEASGYALGGGVFVVGESLLVGSVVSGNTAAGNTAYGGGLYTRTGAVYAVYGSSIDNNHAEAKAAHARGGGVYGSTVAVALSTVSHNTAHSIDNGSHGGGIYASAASIAFQGVAADISDNVASSDCCHASGGGVGASGSISASYSLFAANRASGNYGGVYGGAIAAVYHPTVLVASSTITGNSAVSPSGAAVDAYGGGIATDGSLTTTNSTIAFNHADTYGGGAVLDGGDFSSSIFAKNEAPSGTPSDVASGYGPISIDGTHNIVLASTDVTFATTPLQTDPQLLPLADNGGLTQTHALPPSSVAINAGTASAQIMFDQRLCPFPRHAGSAPDIGAFELSQGPYDIIFGHRFEYAWAGCYPLPAPAP